MPFDDRLPAERLLVDSRIGLIPGIRTYRPVPGGPYVFSAAAPLPKYAAIEGVQAGGGFALSESSARAAALCEAVERGACLETERANLVFGSYRDLGQRFDLLHPEQCPLFHPSQYPGVGYQPFTLETPISWTWAYSLIQHKPLLVPAVLVFLQHPRADQEASLCPPSSNGAACGASLSAAIVQGICELVERDALMVMWLNRHSCPRVHVAPGSPLDQIIQHSLRGDRCAHTLIWMTNDLTRIHACFAVLFEEQHGLRRTYVGAAAHLDPGRAALKAIIETHQIRLWIQDIIGTAQPVRQPADIRTIEQHGLYYAQQDRSAALDFLVHSPRSLDLETLPNYAQGSPARDLQTCLEMFEQAGLDVLVTDLTQEDIRPTGLRVVKVIVPSLVPPAFNHTQRLLGSPRLYELPVRLGWRDRPLTPSEFNPDPHPFA